MAFNSGSLVIRAALVVPLISLWILLHPVQGYACSCVTPGSPSEEMASSAAVFLGKVVSVREFERDDGLMSSSDPTTIEFAVSTVWKGPSYATVFLTTARWGGSCGFTFVKGETYVVYSETYVVYSRDGLTVSLCSRTRSLSESQHDLAEFGKGQAPNPGAIAPTPLSFAPRAEFGKEPAVPEGTAFSHPPSSAPWQTWAIIGPTAVLVVGLMIGAAWLGLRKRRPDGP